MDKLKGELRLADCGSSIYGSFYTSHEADKQKAEQNKLLSECSSMLYTLADIIDQNDVLNDIHSLIAKLPDGD